MQARELDVAVPPYVEGTGMVRAKRGGFPSGRRKRLLRLPAAGVAAAVVLMMTGGSATAAAATPNWTLVSSPDASSPVDNSLAAVSCSSARFCMAVGDYGDSTTGLFRSLAEKWNGSAWTLVSTPAIRGKHLYDLAGVSCPSARFCMAAGFYANRTGHYQTLIEKWNGKHWAKVSSPDTSTTQYNELNGVSCSRVSFCMAVGYHGSKTGASQTLIEKWNGKGWAKVASADTSARLSNVLNGVSCPSASFCMAAGYASNLLGSMQALTEKWNGKHWAKVSPAAISSSENELLGVSCSGPAFCLAVGYYFTGSSGPAQALIENWNGKNWATAGSPDTSGTLLYYPAAVSCVTAKFCIVAGDFTPQPATSVLQQTLILQWNGMTLAAVTSANTSSTQTNGLNGVSCPSVGYCMAAGAYFGAAFSWQTLTEQW
jgi:hypothetical protein